MAGARRIGLAANLDKAQALPVAERLRDSLTAAGCTVLAGDELAPRLGLEPSPITELAAADLVVSLGGDGTLLNTVRDLGKNACPVLGLNLGGLGFLTAFSSNDIDAGLPAIVAGDYAIESRHLLRADFESGGNPAHLEALNEILIDEGSSPRRTVVLRVRVSGADVGTFTADGLIVATPTGSTAYSLSAGGPIVYPTLPGLVLTPVCPHSLAIRPLVIEEHEPVVVESLLPGVTLRLTADGQDALAATDSRPIRIGLSDRKIDLAFLRGRPWYELLRTKLNWGGIPKDR